MISILAYDGTHVSDISPNAYETSINGAMQVWIDVSEPEQADADWLSRVIGLSKQHVADSIGPRSITYFAHTPRYLFGTLQSLKATTARLHAEQIHFFIGKQFFVTVHQEPHKALGDMWQLFSHELNAWQYGLDQILLQLSDRVTATYHDSMNGLLISDTQSLKADQLGISYETPQNGLNPIDKLADLTHYAELQSALFDSLQADPHEAIDENGHATLRRLHQQTANIANAARLASTQMQRHVEQRRYKNLRFLAGTGVLFLLVLIVLSIIALSTL